MTRRGPKPRTANGQPKAPYKTRLATDLIAELQAMPNAAEWLDWAIREGLRRCQIEKLDLH